VHPRAAFAALLAILALAVPATASAGTAAHRDDAIVVISGDVTVPVGKTVEGVFIASGDARILGRVDGDVVVASGDALVGGTISGNLITFGGHARLLRSARVDGDVRYGDQRPDVSPLATVEGDVAKEDFTGGVDVLPFIGGFVVWLAVGFSLMLLGALLLLMAPRTADALQARARERVGPTIAIGIAILICLPVASFLAAVTLLGLPLAIGILMAMGPLVAVAYTVAAYVLGRAMVKAPRNRILAFLAGLAVLRALALVPILGFLVGIAAVVFGLGLIGAAIGAARGPDPDPEPVQPQIPGI
jgi:hypothetical protein